MYMAKPFLCKSMSFDWFFLGWGFEVWTPSMENVNAYSQRDLFGINANYG